MVWNAGFYPERGGGETPPDHWKECAEFNHVRVNIERNDTTTWSSNNNLNLELAQTSAAPAVMMGKVEAE